MPDVTRTVSRTTSLLARMGYSRQDSLREVLTAARSAAGKVSPADGLSPSWLDQLATEAEARLRAISHQSPTRPEARERHASTTEPAPAAAEARSGAQEHL